MLREEDEVPVPMNIIQKYSLPIVSLYGVRSSSETVIFAAAEDGEGGPNNRTS